jgi:hypothetical protein
MSVFTRAYETYPQAEQTVAALQSAGIDPSDISLIANREASAPYKTTEAQAVTTDAGIGALVGGGAGLLAGLAGLAIPGVGPVVAAGWLVTTVIGALAGTATGGLIGALTETGVSEDDANVYAEAVRRGGTLLTVRSSLGDEVTLAALNQSGPIDPLARRADYESEGWSRFEPGAGDSAGNEMDGEKNASDRVSPAVAGVPFPNSF